LDKGPGRHHFQTTHAARCR